MTTMVDYERFVRQMGTKGGVFMPLEIIALGLCGEAAEWASAVSGPEGLLELGDVLFYAVAMGIRLGLRPYRPQYADVNHAGNLVDRVCAMADMVKKIEWHKREDLLDTLPVHLDDFFHAINCVAFRSGYTLEQVAEANVAKLKARWPNGFRPV